MQVRNGKKSGSTAQFETLRGSHHQFQFRAGTHTQHNQTFCVLSGCSRLALGTQAQRQARTHVVATGYASPRAQLLLPLHLFALVACGEMFRSESSALLCVVLSLVGLGKADGCCSQDLDCIEQMSPADAVSECRCTLRVPMLPEWVIGLGLVRKATTRDRGKTHATRFLRAAIGGDPDEEKHYRQFHGVRHQI